MGWSQVLLPAALIWAAIWWAPWRAWRTDETLDGCDASSLQRSVELTVLIPARNEAQLLEATLTALNRQGVGIKIVLIDDQSTDDTALRASALGLDNLRIVTGTAPPADWTGKLWALQQGLPFIDTELVLLLDADIELGPGTLSSLCAKMERDDLQLASLMVWLRMESTWERLLMPAFVYFFKLLYPFKLSNCPTNRYVAAAAGGCILLTTSVLDELGGFGSIRGALIDDCTLARAVKSRGHRTWIGLTRSARSLRPYPSLADIWRMVARTAYTQLGYSVLMLLLCSAVMLCAFAGPMFGLLSGTAGPTVVSFAILAAAGASYIPTLAYYGRSKAWAITLPVVGLLYLAMTWGSAIRHWTGVRAQWKGRRFGT